MNNTYLNLLCEQLDNQHPQDKSTANSFYYRFKYDIIPPLKSEISSNLLALSKDDKTEYLEFIINEIESKGYFKNCGISTIQKHLEKYKVNLQDILDFKIIRTNPKFCNEIFDIHYKYFQGSEEGQIAYSVQEDFINYFCSYVADDIVKLCNMKLDKLQVKTTLTQPQQSNTIDNTYLNEFCKSISNQKEMSNVCFMQLYKHEITHFTPYLKDEILLNMLHLGEQKKGIYLNYVLSQVKNTPYALGTSINISSWLETYCVSMDDYPYFKEGKIYKDLNTFTNGNYEVPNRDNIVDMQYDFYGYAARLEAEEIITFTQSYLNNNTTQVANEAEAKENKPKQLSTNQAVILLDKLGVFASNYLANQPNTKKAKIISQLIGKNEKNTKTAIENLEKKQSDLSSGYNSDIDKIQAILDKLE